MTSPRLAIHDRMVELADTTRCRLLAALERQELTVGELATALQLPQSTVSRHLRILADQAWISSRAEGASRWYRRNPLLDADMLGLWELVRSAMASTPGALQDAARLDAVVAARRSGTQAFFATASAEWDALRTDLFGARADLAAALALPGIVASAIFVFLESLDEFTGSYFVGAPEIRTLPLMLYSAGAGGNIQIAAISALILLVPSILFMLLVERFLKGEVLAKMGR